MSNKQNITPEERNRRFSEGIASEVENGNIQCWWLSFCDPGKPEGEQFLGVVVVRAFGLLHAIDKAWYLGINPGGEVLGYVTDSTNMELKHFNKLLSLKELTDSGYVDS